MADLGLKEMGLGDFFMFGKYKDTDMTLQEVIDEDLGYIEWCLTTKDDFILDPEAMEYKEWAQLDRNERYPYEYSDFLYDCWREGQHS